MSKQFICKKGWARHSKGTIINEWEYNKLATESKEQFFEEFNPKPEVVPEPIAKFSKDLEGKLQTAGIKAEFKHKVKDGVSELDAKFKFKDENDI